jgi:hypothetical protein
MLAAVLAGCATAETQPSAAVTSLSADAQRVFRLSWDVEPDRGGERRLRGYLENTFGEPVTRIQLLGQALDASGNVIGQRLQWVPGAIPSFGRAYFEIPKLPPADRYRVTVWAYDRVRGVSSRGDGADHLARLGQ